MKEYFMLEALKEAQKAFNSNEVPVGAVIVCHNEIIACAHNQKEKNNDVLSHAELLAIREAEKKIGNWRLSDCEIYVTLEPCPMCASALQQARISKIYYGVDNIDLNMHKIVQKIILPTNTNPGIELVGGLLSDQSKKMLTEFFMKKRKEQTFDIK